MENQYSSEVILYDIHFHTTFEMYPNYSEFKAYLVCASKLKRYIVAFATKQRKSSVVNTF